MRLCIPTMGIKGLDELVGEHFGRVPTYTMVNPDTNEVNVIENTSEHMGGSGYPASLIAQKGIEVMICSGLGKRAIMMFEENGIMVYMGAHGTVRDAIKMWKDGGLQVATDENACEQHAFRKEDHDHHHHGNCER